MPFGSDKLHSFIKGNLGFGRGIYGIGLLAIDPDRSDRDGNAKGM